MKLKHKQHKAFTLVEVAAAILIVAAIVSSVMVVMNRAIAATIDSKVKMRAFQIARENMETLLASATISDMTEFGYDELNPDIEWQTVVEPFYEPVTNRMWINAVCSATYYDSNDEQQTIELTHWLTDLTKEQIQQILNQQQAEQDFLTLQQYEENIAQQEDAIRKYLSQANLATASFNEFAQELETERQDWLDEYEFDPQLYGDVVYEQVQQRNDFLEEELGVDLSDLDTWAQQNAPTIPGLTTPEITPTANDPVSPDTPTGNESTPPKLTADELRNMGVPESWIPFFL